MGKLIFIVGKSGMGKSTSLRNLNPDETVIINTDQKPLPFKKFGDKYNEAKGNYLKSSDVVEVMNKLKECHKDGKTKTIIIDTWSRMMTDLVMSKSFRGNSGFEKWGNLSGSQYDLINTINERLTNLGQGNLILQIN